MELRESVTDGELMARGVEEVEGVGAIGPSLGLGFGPVIEAWGREAKRAYGLRIAAILERP